jgi:hypothetical protein
MSETAAKMFRLERLYALNLMARRFVQSKRLMPKDGHELVAWLIEFDEEKSKMIDEWERLFLEHMQNCNRPIIMPLYRGAHHD